MTSLGSVIDRYREKWRFSNIGLFKEGGLSKSDLQLISRMSADVDKVRSCSPKMRVRLIASLTNAMFGHFEKKWGIEIPSSVKEQIKEEFTEAMDQDTEESYLRPMALFVAKTFSRVSGKSIPELYLLSRQSASWDEFVASLKGENG